MAVSQDLLEILRCPYCVSGPTRKPGNDPGRLELVRDGWLVCQEPDCGRKYPIKEDIPVMLIEEGDKWINTPVEELPEPGKLVEPGMFSAPAASPVTFQSQQNSQQGLLLAALALTALALLIAGLLYWRSSQRG